VIACAATGEAEAANINASANRIRKKFPAARRLDSAGMAIA
jgi:hypothetical protein